MLIADDLVKLSESYSTELSKRMNINVVQHGGKPLFETNRMPFVSRDSPISNDTNDGKEISGGADVCETTESDLNSPLLRHTLRDYQLNGVRWLRNCFLNNLNVLLADEMGLGKTIQTIALLSTLATEFGNWGPHLIVVPTSVMLNWEVEFKKWCPALKVFSYFGSVKERRSKRSGWSKPNSFHVCITSYRIVTQDQTIFRRKNWEYLILDEAHMIKNWRSQRWQTLLTFNTKRRLLITGTPLQNDLMELWALMHFLMPALFNSHSEFKDWFANPMIAMIDGTETVNNSLVKRLHSILRPFILRRLKTDVEKSLPKKHEHVLKCPLSRRQRRLYEEYISSDGTLKTLSSGNMVGVMHCLMQLRKVCNHPDLFAGRQICTSFDMRQISWISPSVLSLISSSLRRKFLGEFHFESAHVDALNKIRDDLMLNVQRNYKDRAPQTDDELNLADLILQALRQKRRESNSSSIKHPLECGTRNVKSLIDAWDAHCPVNPAQNKVCYSLIWQVADIETSSLRYTFLIPRVRSNVTYEELCWLDIFRRECAAQWNTRAQQALAPIRKSVARQCLFFPDRCLVQYDCGKLQILASLLRQLKYDGHKALIFTQMTKMLDVLETFLNLHGYTYCRLDGSTNAEQRQLLMQRFNSDDRIFIFILSTRSGGFGINLTGADTVIFYDSDWNPAMDQQAQDRCHRIGQTREVHIYRLISEGTIEESILQKAIQKRQLDNMAIQLGNFDTSTVPAISTVPAVLDDDVESFPLRSQRCKLEKESTDIRNDIPEPLQTSTHPFEPTALSKVEKYALSICRQYTDISDGDNVT
ncbi:MAG: hypothetical protein CMB73_05430 [Euryarchaeota archaeon]|nr:hypothetical protein [Euryarchaeota archaeon]|tara:strand:- start:1554 stop:3995 length:2442 start_codon:yes stop_codon:yes gene_type:complete